MAGLLFNLLIMVIRLGRLFGILIVLVNVVGLIGLRRPRVTLKTLWWRSRLRLIRTVCLIRRIYRLLVMVLRTKNGIRL